MEDQKKQSLPRLLEAANHKGVAGAAAVARALGASDQTVNNWKDRGVPSSQALKAEKMWGVSAQWIAYGTGEQWVKPTFDSNVRMVPEGVRSYPVISFIQAGLLKEISDPYSPGDGFDIEYGEDDASAWAVFLQIEGDSMLPEFKPGDRVRIDPEVTPRPGDFVAARNTKQEATFKKYRVRGIDERGQEIFELVPLNPDYPVLRSDEHHLTVIGTMTEHRRRYRRQPDR